MANETERQQILLGDCRDILPTLPAGSVQCCVTSPPYYGLRDYGTAQWEGGKAGCDHANGRQGATRRDVSPERLAERAALYGTGTGNSSNVPPQQYRDLCPKCGGRRIDSQLGLEATSEEYVAKMVAVFREVWRVLKPDGTCWINFGDSFGIGANLSDCISARIEGSVLCIGAACTLTITAKGENVLGSDKSFPNGKLTRLFGVKRVFFKQRDNYLGQVIDLLNAESCVVVNGFLSFLRISESDLEVALDQANHISVIVSQRDLNSDTPFEVSISSGTAENRKATFAIKESAEPISEGVINGKSAGNSISLDAFNESRLQVDAIDKPVPFRDAAVSRSSLNGDFMVAKACGEKLTLSMMQGTVEIALGSVGHVYFRNGFGSLISYADIYDQAYRDMRENGAKQELGIPFRLRRALVRDGWICRSTIIWHKPNPMPESVTDRPTKAHEYIFLLTKSERYFYDAEAIKEPASGTAHARGNGINPKARIPAGWDTGEGAHTKLLGRYKVKQNSSFSGAINELIEDRNKRTVWMIATQPYSEAHFATFPEEIPKLCILAGSKPGDTILDLFAGSGTVGKVALELGRKAILIELNPAYVQLAHERTNVTPGFF